MATTFSMVSQKGGVGKTTVSLNLSLALAKQGLKTLLVDVDPQGGVGHSLAGEQTVSGLKGYLGGDKLSNCLLRTRIPDFSILPVGEMRGLERAAMSHQLEDGLRLQVLVDSCKSFDVIVFDTPAGLSGATLGALRASDFALTTLQAEPLAANSFPQLLELIGELRDEGARVEMKGIILTMVQREVSASLSVVEMLWEKLPASLILNAHIPRDAAFLKASELGVPIGMMSKRPPPIAHRFDELASEISNLIPEEEGDHDPINLLI